MGLTMNRAHKGQDKTRSYGPKYLLLSQKGGNLEQRSKLTSLVADPNTHINTGLTCDEALLNRMATMTVSERTNLIRVENSTA